MIKFAEYPQRQCRLAVTEDGLIDHHCGLPELHAGPCCPKSLQPAIDRREAWQEANPGWENLPAGEDPFADITIPEEQK